MSKKFFSEIEIKKIEESLKAAEKNSDGEIVPIFAKASDSYDASKYIFAILITLVSTFLVIDFSDSKSMIAISLLASFIVGINLARFFPVLCLPFIHKSEMQNAVNSKAAEYFYNYNLGNTKLGSAVLIYVSKYEHIAVVKTDLRSGKIISKQDLQEICNDVIEGIKTKNAADGLIKAINKTGHLLEKHFPNKSVDNQDEIPNKIYFV